MKKMTFWGRDDNDERLLVECMLGLKTATCTPKVWCDDSTEDGVSNVGDRYEVYTKKGKLACAIEITEVYEIPFGKIQGEIGEKIARGENCSLDQFITDHIFSWEKALEEEGYTLNEDTIVVVEHFALLENYIDFRELGHRVQVNL